MPQRRKSGKQKALVGTFRPDRDFQAAEFDALEGDVAPMGWLSSPEAVKEWKRLVKLLGPVRTLTAADLTALGHLCNLHGACVRMYQAGMEPKAAQLTQLRLYLMEFGLTPASRAKAPPIPQGEKQNPFTGLKRA